MRQTAPHPEFEESVFLQGIKVLLVPIVAVLLLGIAMAGLHVGSVGGIYAVNSLTAQDHQLSAKTKHK